MDMSNLNLQYAPQVMTAMGEPKFKHWDRRSAETPKDITETATNPEQSEATETASDVKVLTPRDALNQMRMTPVQRIMTETEGQMTVAKRETDPEENLLE